MLQEEMWQGEEGAEVKVAALPKPPKAEEVEIHNATHLPFRSWCPHCVRGKAKAHPHHRAKRKGEVPVVSIDYMFMSQKQGVGEEKGMPILVMKDRESGTVMSRLVPEKGATGYAVKRLAQDIDLLGYNKLVLKSDQEPAIIALKAAVKRENINNIILEESPVADSQGNGMVERAVQEVQGQVRTLKDALETRYGIKVLGGHTCLPWLVSHAGNLISRYKKMEDGRAAYERVKGRAFTRSIAEFGECVWYLKPGSKGKDKFDCRWDEGVYLGIRRASGY